MQITKSQSHQHYPTLHKTPPKPKEADHESSQPSEITIPFVPILAGGGAVALGASMLYPGQAGMIYQSITKPLAPALQFIGPILEGGSAGGLAGAMTGAAYGALASAGATDSTPVFAVFGGLMGGTLLGAVTGGIATACGGNPLLAVPVTVAACAGMHILSSGGGK